MQCASFILSKDLDNVALSAKPDSAKPDSAKPEAILIQLGYLREAPSFGVRLDGAYWDRPISLGAGCSLRVSRRVVSCP